MPLRVAVLYGGRSGEHEISLRSAESIIAGLDRAKYEVQRIFITPEGRWEPRAISPEPGANPGIDVVFPVLHGTFGEDGTVQGLLELADLPYVGAGVLASAVAMDKEVTKRLLVERGLPVAEYVTVTRGRPSEFNLPFPLFVKPANLGSSVGISKVKTCAELPAALELAGQFDRKILVERGIAGREFECSVLGSEQPIAAVPCEVIPSRDFYDYEDKYLLDAAKLIVPAPLTPEQTAEMQRHGGRRLPGRRVRRHGARRFSDGDRDGQALHQRDQYHPGLHFHFHVSENVGSGGRAVCGAFRPPDRSGSGPSPHPPKHAL